MKIQNNIVFSIISLRILKKKPWPLQNCSYESIVAQNLRGSRPHAMVIRVVGFSSEGVQNWKKNAKKKIEF